MSLEDVIANCPKWEDTEKELFRDKELALGFLKEEIKEFNKGGDVKYLLNAINLLIQYSNISITEIEKCTGLTRTTVYNIINQKNEPKLSTLQSILKEFGYTICLKPINKKQLA